MKITVFGAGAIGCVVAGRMAAADLNVTLIARGQTLTAIKERGLTLITGGQTENIQIHAIDDTNKVGSQDIVIVALMANMIRPALKKITPLIGSKTTVVAAQNGIPWWYFHNLPGNWPRLNLNTVDKDGEIWKSIGPEKVLGCTIRMSASLIEPSIAKYSDYKIYNIGEPDGVESLRLNQVVNAFSTAGFSAITDMNIRKSVWSKVCSNIGVNPISVICNATMGEMCGETRICEVIKEVLQEVYSVTKELGIELEPDIRESVEDGARLGSFRTSTLQSFDNGKPIELDSIVGATSEIGQMIGVPTPMIDTIYALTRLRAKVADCYVAP